MSNAIVKYARRLLGRETLVEKFLSVSKDGGRESHVWAYWLVEIKWLFSIVLLRFEDGSRDAYHSHAFNAVSWVLRGRLREYLSGGDPTRHDMLYVPSLLPVLTPRSRTHRVVSVGRTWVLSFRGPWARTWREIDGKTGTPQTLTHGRRKVAA